MSSPPSPQLNSLKNICLEIKLFDIDQFSHGCLQSQNFFKLILQKNVDQKLDMHQNGKQTVKFHPSYFRSLVFSYKTWGFFRNDLSETLRQKEIELTSEDLFRITVLLVVIICLHAVGAEENNFRYIFMLHVYLYFPDFLKLFLAFKSFKSFCILAFSGS